MLRNFCFLCCAVAWSATTGAAADWSTLYDTTKLQAEQARLQTAIDFLVQKEIQPFLSPQETTAFGLQPLDLPLSGTRSDPLDFYALNRHIILPVRTLLFIEDLSRAYGWMWANRFTTRTVDEYLSMLHYRSPADFVNGKYPSPLEALHIPENALADSRVVETSVRLRRTAYAFILLHQFAHLQLHHDPSGSKASSDFQEEEADRYALNIMKANSVTPTGIYLVLYSSMFFETGDGISLHPVTPHRLDAMAHYMDSHVIEFIAGRSDKARARDGIQSIASLLMEGSEWLSVRGHLEALQQLAMRTDPSTLLPRPLPKSTK